MITDHVSQKVFAIIAEEFNIEAEEIDCDTVSSDVDGWDSIRHINLLIRLEIAFSLKLDTQSISNLKNVGDLIEVIRKG